LERNTWDNLDDCQGGNWVLKKLSGKINAEAPAVVAILLMRHLSQINTNSPQLKGSRLEMLQKYHLKLLSFNCRGRLVRKGIQNMQYPFAKKLSIELRIKFKYYTYCHP
jgi:hypothetical protein